MKGSRRNKGAAIVEVALIIPFVMLFVLGVVDVARAFFDSAKVQEAAQEGAVYAALHPDAPLDAIARAEETIRSPDFTGSIAVTCPASDQVTVTVTHAFDLITPFIANMLGNTIDVTHSETAAVLSDGSCTPSP